MNSYRHWTGEELVAREGSVTDQAERLYHAPAIVVSHGTEPDPILCYGNLAALRLWELSLIELLKAMLWLLIIVVIAQAILSWTAPDGPLSGVLNAMTFRFLAPIRRTIPPIGGTLDLSPLILIVIVQLVLMLPVRWLEVAVLQVFR